MSLQDLEAGDALRGGVSRPAAILAAAPFAVALVDGELPFEGRVLDSNAAFDRLVGRRRPVRALANS